ncbi:hypothetical protein AC579_5693 [Pseudocercospora musae]|uniref:Uncharacterized protein n=1 Tax=Pseudocercospora musae TaxID=113226 RepID=A0A139IRW0_9PEZI|nr:hypothetical protein AC579_5693 [Pseudocercospora musae]
MAGSALHPEPLKDGVIATKAQAIGLAIAVAMLIQILMKQKYYSAWDAATCVVWSRWAQDGRDIPDRDDHVEYGIKWIYKVLSLEELETWHLEGLEVNF